MKKPAIPATPKATQPREKFDAAVKETLEVITGRRSGQVKPLAADADLAAVVAKINEIIDRLQ